MLSGTRFCNGTASSPSTWFDRRNRAVGHKLSPQLGAQSVPDEASQTFQTKGRQTRCFKKKRSMSGHATKPVNERNHAAIEVVCMAHPRPQTVRAYSKQTRQLKPQGARHDDPHTSREQPRGSATETKGSMGGLGSPGVTDIVRIRPSPMNCARYTPGFFSSFEAVWTAGA